MDFDLIIAITAIIGSIIAILALIIEYRRHRFSLGIDLILKLNDQFHNEHIRKCRKKSAMIFESKFKNIEHANEIDEIIDFLEELAFFVEKGSLNKKVVWYYFFSFYYRFWTLSEEYILKERKKDPTLWVGATNLYKSLLEIEKKDRVKHRAKIQLTKKDLNKFIEEEKNIV